MITTVTITGADNGTQYTDLLNLSEKYPFAEWAILIKGGKSADIGSPRWPSYNWISGLAPIAHRLRLSLHLCGRYVNEILDGNIDFIATDLAPIWQMFNRVQINTHGIPHSFNQNSMIELMKLYPNKEFIFQYDNENSDILLAAHRNGVNCSTLFDLSHGAGVSPSQWPDLLPGIKCGYAGGISPENIVKECIRVSEKTGEIETWIDMETHVRSNNDKVFDLTKVESCLSQAQPFVKELTV